MPIGAKGAFSLMRELGHSADAPCPSLAIARLTDGKKGTLQPSRGNADIRDMTDPQRRALRTLLQAIVGALGAGLVNLLAPDGVSPEWLAVIGVVLTTIFTQIQNSLEDSGTIPAILKAPASEGANPVPDPD